MAILGVETVIFGVDDFDRCTKFWRDFGLNPLAAADDEHVFDVPRGSRVIVRRASDPRLPPASFDGPGLRETILGCDTQASVDAYAARVATDRAVTRDADGAVHFLDDDGNPFGLRVWNKKPVVCRPDPVNAPDCIQRFNAHRKWRTHAQPKTINHVVYYSGDYVRSFDFFRDRLDFRLTDHMKGLGVFGRADGANEHHTIFWVAAEGPRFGGKTGHVHIAFGVEDIDELMLGANLMQERGWSNERDWIPGLNRHRVSSALYYYFDSPCGGEAEYHADSDYIDDTWVPRAWERKFGSLLWSSIPTALHETLTWDMTLDPEGKTLEAYRKAVQPPARKKA